MRHDYYFGIENEFTVHDKMMPTMIDTVEGPRVTWQQVSMPSLWRHLMKDYHDDHIKKHATCIRTSHGTSVYCDGDEVEVCTPPIRVTPGFANVVAHTLYNARHCLAKLLLPAPQLAVVGYSMHWNMTNRFDRDHLLYKHTMREVLRGGRVMHATAPDEYRMTAARETARTIQHIENSEDEEILLHAIASPLGLFMLTPNSSGIGARYKPGRYELLGDHIPGEEQTASATLLYAGMMLGIERRIMPIRTRVCYDDPPHNKWNYFQSGRESPIVMAERGKLYVITAQEHLERTYRKYRDVIAEISTPDERRTLEEHITGARPLEIDKQDIYRRLQQFKVGTDYRANNTTAVPLRGYRRSNGNIDRMSMFLGWLAKNPGMIEEIEWDDISLRMKPIEGKDLLELPSIDDVEHVAQVITRLEENERLPALNALFRTAVRSAESNYTPGVDIEKDHTLFFDDSHPPKLNALGKAWLAANAELDGTAHNISTEAPR